MIINAFCTSCNSTRRVAPIGRAAQPAPASSNAADNWPRHQDMGRLFRGRHERPVRSPVDLPRPSASPPTKRQPSRGKALRTSTGKLPSFVVALPSNSRQRRSAQRSGTSAGRTSAVWTSITDVLSRSLGRSAAAPSLGRRSSEESMKTPTGNTKSSSFSRSSSSPDSFRESTRDARRARWDRSARAGTLWRTATDPGREEPSPPPPRKPRSDSMPGMRGGVGTANAVLADNAARFNRAVSPATYRLCSRMVSPSAQRPRTSPSFLRAMLRLKLSPPLSRHRASPEAALRPRVSPVRVRGQPGVASSRPRETEPVEELRC